MAVALATPRVGGPILTGANLAAALLFNSDFTRADLRNANLTEAQLGTNLHPAELADGEFGPVNLAHRAGPRVRPMTD